MPTYPTSPRAASVSDMLLRPQVISRRLTELTNKLGGIGDTIFERGTAQQVAGGAVPFQRSESIYLDRDVEEVGVRGGFPRAGWTEEIFTAYVRQYGLETPVNDLSQRRNAMDQFRRGLRKLSNNMVRFVDTAALSLLLADPDVLTEPGTQWTGAAAGVIIADVANAIKRIRDLQEGYNPDTLIVHADQELDILMDPDIASRLPREVLNGPINTGSPWPMLGLSRILRTYQIATGTAVVLESKMVGTIADEEPLASEGYVAFAPGANAQGDQFATVYTKLYREEGSSDTIIRAARWPAMWLAEPGAACKITTI